MDADDHFTPGQAAPADPARSGPQSQRYRKCPVCSQIMHRRNYARRSGVIIDVCRDHGLWFDADELPRIIAWIRAGGMAKAGRERAEEQERQQRLQRPFVDKSSRRARIWSDVGPEDGNAGLAEVLVETVSWIFGP